MNFLEIKILGTRGEIESSKPYHSNHSGILIDNTILFDIGEKEFLKYNSKYIFITHLHPDHAFFVRKSYKNSIDFCIPVYAPETYKDNFSIKKFKRKMSFNSYSIRPIPTHHSKKVKSTAFLIKNNKHKILYTGDLIWINKEYHNYFNDLDLVITEASFIRKIGMVKRDKETGQIYGHSGVPRLINIFKEFTNNILLTHFGEWFYEDIPKARKILKKFGRQYNVNIIVGYDDLKINIKNLS